MCHIMSLVVRDLKKIFLEIDNNEITFYLRKGKKLISNNSFLINDKGMISNILDEYYKMGYRKVFIILKTNIEQYKILSIYKIKNNHINNIVKINILKHYAISEKDYYYD